LIVIKRFAGLPENISLIKWFRKRLGEDEFNEK
jgi:hypothetical protein